MRLTKAQRSALSVMFDYRKKDIRSYQGYPSGKYKQDELEALETLRIAVLGTPKMKVKA